MELNHHTQTIVASGTNLLAWGITIADINDVLTAISLSAAICASLVVAYVNWKKRDK